MVHLTEVTDPSLPVFYVSVYDSTERPEVFPDTEAAQRWVNENRPDWKVDTEIVRQRWNARIGYDSMVQQSQAEGWYKRGPAPDPETPGSPDSEYSVVGVAHAGLTCFVYVDQSDAEASQFLSNLSRLHRPDIRCTRSI